MTGAKMAESSSLSRLAIFLFITGVVIILVSVTPSVVLGPHFFDWLVIIIGFLFLIVACLIQLFKMKKKP